MHVTTYFEIFFLIKPPEKYEQKKGTSRETVLKLQSKKLQINELVNLHFTSKIRDCKLPIFSTIVYKFLTRKKKMLNVRKNFV